MWESGAQNIQDDGTFSTKHVPCSEDIRQFMSQYRQQQLKAIERNSRIRIFGVVIDELRASDKIFVTGRSEGVHIALGMVQTLVDKVVCDSFEIVQPGIATYCAKSRFDSLLRIVNNDEKCYVRVEKKFLRVTSATSTFNGSAGAVVSSTPVNSTAGASGARSSSDTSSVLVTPQGQQVSWKVGDITTEQVRLCSLK